MLASVVVSVILLSLSLLPAQHVPDNRTLLRLLRSANDSLTSQAPVNRTLPEVIIFGARKCGTRALLQFLSVHPRIAAAQTEVHFFDRNFDRGFEWYRQQLPAARADQLTVEKTPSYFVTPDAARRVREMNASVKLVLIVREPVTRIVSDYAQVWAKRLDARNATLPPLEDLILDKFTNSVDLSFKPAWVSVYHHHMTEWLRYFPLQQIHVVDGDVFAREPAAELAKVERFLQIEAHLSQEKFVFNQTKGFFCIRTASRGSDQQLSSQLRCLGDAKGRKHPHISSALTKKLRLFYKHHNRLFFKLINQTFDW